MALLSELARLVGGKVVGDATRVIRGVADLASAGAEEISFLASPKYRDAFAKTRAGAVLTAEAIAEAPTSLIVCTDPYLALAQIAAFLHPPAKLEPGREPGALVHATALVDLTATVRMGAVVDAGARVGARSVIGPGAYVGQDARIGADVYLHAGAKVLDRCVLEDRVILQAGAVIGSDGFGYAPDSEGRRHKIPQVGYVLVGADAEIGANTTIDRATFGHTRIGPGTKIDNLVQIAHNVVTGRDCVVVAQSGVAGSTRLGDRVIVGAQAGIVGHIEIVSDVMLGARTGVPNHIRESGIYSGVPSMPHRQWLKVAMAQATVPELRRRVRELERQLARLLAKS